ncbi:putative ankyrin repeat-containing domain [Rosellinia necatrix]|uniref:Putative ankyrin repeat-containing domain n=1 Tax=Rosellinia necatrix TaxID=77044 RepID=A0A1S8A4T4_ROSNE|nr:putative ankyrin repeat-containing domain [Rosellinia necatrix]
MKYCRPHDPKSFGPDIEVTLDEYCNPTLGSTLLQQRNNDQVVTRYIKRQRLEGRVTGNHLVTVSQLWCWKIGSKLMFSGNKAVQYHVQQALYHDDHDIYIGRILSFLIDRLDQPHTFGLTEPIFSIFSRSISVVAEDVNRYVDSTTFGDIDIQEERKLLHNINDIREEIAMMETVLFQQEEIWKEFTYNTWPQFWPDGENGRFKSPFNHGNGDVEVWREISKPQSQFSKYRKRFQKLDEDAERVERHILVQLDLKQKHAALKETHTTTVMSASVVGFTVITVIFTPLSFLTSLFALPVDHFSQNQQDGKYTVNYIGKWIATGEIASLAVTAVAILLACVYFLNLRVTAPAWMPALSANPKGSHGIITEGFDPNNDPLLGDISKGILPWRSRKRGHSRDVEQQHNLFS